MNRLFSCLPALAAVLMSGALVAQQPRPKTFTNPDVIKMVKVGLDDSTVVLAIQQHPAQYDTSFMKLRKYIFSRPGRNDIVQYLGETACTYAGRVSEKSETGCKLLVILPQG